MSKRGDDQTGGNRARATKSFAHAEATVTIAVVTTLTWLLKSRLVLADIAILHTLGVVVVAARLGLGPALLAAALSVVSYNFFFIPPVFGLAVDDGRHLLTFGMIFGIGVVISTLTDRVRRQEYDARTREERTAALYALSRALGNAGSEQETLDLIAQHAAQVFKCSTIVLCPDASGVLGAAAAAGRLALSAEERRVAERALSTPESTNAKSTGDDEGVYCFPLRVGATPLGVLVLSRTNARGGSILDTAFAEAFAHQGALALTRSRLAEEARSALLRAQTEAMRSSLLSAVSHDLRTPLAVITGAGSTLRDEAASVSSAQRHDLAVTICEEADRLERLVRNLLDMTRVESKSLDVNREWVSVDDLVTSAMARMEEQLTDRTITLDLPEGLPLLRVDPILFGQVFVNLIDNATKYTPSSSPIEIRACLDGETFQVDVADRGGGFAANERERVFEKFFRGSRAAKPGAGLGLAICRGIVEAHGGSLIADNRASGGGALLRITLPRPAVVPPIPADPVGMAVEQAS